MSSIETDQASIKLGKLDNHMTPDERADEIIPINRINYGKMSSLALSVIIEEWNRRKLHSLQNTCQQ